MCTIVMGSSSGMMMKMNRLFGFWQPPIRSTLHAISPPTLERIDLTSPCGDGSLGRMNKWNWGIYNHAQTWNKFVLILIPPLDNLFGSFSADIASKSFTCNEGIWQKRGTWPYIWHKTSKAEWEFHGSAGTTLRCTMMSRLNIRGRSGNVWWQLMTFAEDRDTSHSTTKRDEMPRSCKVGFLKWNFTL